MVAPKPVPPKAAFSQNGWPVASDLSLIKVKNFDVPGTHLRHFSCSALVAPILIAVAAKYHKIIQPIDTGTYDDWGCNRMEIIPGQTDYSNHASGTAIDINATLHPWKTAPEKTFTTKQIADIRTIVKKYGVRWGGDYKYGWKDPMHFEIIETPAQVKARIASMKLSMPQLSK